MPSIGPRCVIIHLSIIHVIYNALLKSDVSGDSNAYSSHNFQPTGIGLGFIVKSKRVCITNYLGLPINSLLLLFFFKVVYFAKKICAFQKIP